jgi:hypothetical protein
MSDKNNNSKKSESKPIDIKFGREVRTPSNSLKPKNPPPPKDKK